MTIESIIAERKIAEVLHFTTNNGIAGILASRALKARDHLTADAYLEHLTLLNCPDRSRDVDWHGYVNLSLSRITPLIGPSETWHRDFDGWWCVLSFRPEILTHEGVVFCTTNNMYSGVNRGEGPAGLNALFAERIVRWSSYRSTNIITRPADLEPKFPTCVQAEALYPKEVPVSFLARIYTRTPEHVDAIRAMCGGLGVPAISCEVRPDCFR